MRAFLKLTPKAARRCIGKILVYYIPMCKAEICRRPDYLALAGLRAWIVGARPVSAKIVSHARREPFAANNRTGRTP